ncbi:MAG: ferritin family protein [Ignavibacteria bacterium]
MLPEDITALEALGIAIRSEIDAQNVYRDLAELCNNELLKERFENLAKEEKKHQLILENIYKNMFPDVELVLPESFLPKHATTSMLRKQLGLKDILLIAIDEERRSREFYLDCASEVKDLSGQRMFRFIADMEFSHQMILQAELEMLEKFPFYYDSPKSWEAELSLKAEKIKRQ